MLKRVLVLDNDPVILDVMDEALRYEGFEVNVFEETEDIISLISKCKPDLLIIDYILKGINGGELCKKIKNTLSTCHLPVIIFSAYPKALQLLGCGYNAFLAKPFDLSAMIDMVKDLAEGNSKTRTNTSVIEY